MAETCAFEGTCPMMADIIEISGACAEKRGEKCGRVAAYGMFKWQLHELAELDDEASIDATFTITEVPDGFPPENIRQEWVGVRLPVRGFERSVDDMVRVSPADAVLSLLESGKLDAADWFIRAGIVFGGLDMTWGFKKSDGQLEPTDPVSSRQYYGAGLTPEVRAALEA